MLERFLFLRFKFLLMTETKMYWRLAHSPKERILQEYEADEWRVLSSTVVLLKRATSANASLPK